MLSLEFYNHYPAPISFQQNTLFPPLKKALTAIYEEAAHPAAVIHHLDTVEFNLVDDTTITDLHCQYMDDPTPTDVITFHHGEVFISYDTAIKQATQRNIPLTEELLRYHIHGLLHLAGYDDLTETDFQEMFQRQETLVHLVK